MKRLLLRVVAFAFFLTAASARAAVITVTATTDAAGNDGVCSIYEAIIAANQNAAYFDCPAGSPGLDTVAFNVGGGGAQTITLSFDLPDILEPLDIDGTTQPGFAGTPLILVRGTGSFPYSATWGFVFTPTAPGSRVRKLAMGQMLFPINVATSNTTVSGMYFGLDQSGVTTIPSYFGLFVSGGTGNVIGGPAAPDRNFYAGLLSGAIAVSFVPPGNVIQGNFIGFDAAGTPVGTNGGISMQSSIGTRVVDNHFAGLVGGGMSLTDSNENIIQNNVIGVAAPSGNFGITLQNSRDNVIGAMTSGGPGANIIANTTFFSGVWLTAGSTGNRILSNSIYNITGLPIDLDTLGQVEPSDPCDADTGSNQLQNRPVLTSAAVGGGTTTVVGSLNSTASSSFTIEFFSNPTSDNEGRTFLGSRTVNTDAGCNGSFAAVLPLALALGTYITATATDAAGNTSEFSDAQVVVAALQVTKTFDPPVRRPGEPSLLTITFQHDTGTSLDNLAFSDTYPAGLVNVTPLNVSSTCGGTVMATAGGGSLSLTGGSVPLSGTCSVTAMVVANDIGTYVNTLPAGSITATNAAPNAAPVTAVLSVHQPVPTLSTWALAGLAIALAFIAVVKRGV